MGTLFGIILVSIVFILYHNSLLANPLEKIQNE